MRRVGGDPPAGAGFLSVPKLQQRDMGSTKRLNLPELLVSSTSIQGSQHELWLHPHGGEQLGVDVSLGSPSSAAPSEDVSPECVAPAVMLVPPPYGAATQTASLQSPVSSGSANITVDEGGQTDIHSQGVHDEIVDVMSRRRHLSVDCETGQESTPSNFYNMRSISGSSSDVPPNTDAASGDTDPRQTSSDAAEPCTSETHPVPSSSQPLVENEPHDTWIQQTLLKTSVKTTAAPICGNQQVPSDESGCVRDRRLSCELHSVQDDETKGENMMQEFGDKGDGSKERLVMSASSEEETSQQQLLLPESQSCSK